MNIQILRQLSFAFLPIIIFIIAETFYGVKTGIIIAMIFSAGEFVYTKIKTGNTDYFILFDVLLISVLGGISIVSANDLFFKLKPAFLQFLILGIFGIAGFSDYPLMENMAGRYLKDIQISDFQRKQMKIMARQVFFVFLVHTVLVIYTAFYSSTKVWAFVSGGLFYVIFGVFMAYQWFQNRRILKNSKKVDVFDGDENKVGEIPEMLLEANPGLLHKSAHLHIFNGENEMFLLIRDGKYDIPLSTHVYTNETVSEALKRVMKENMNENEFIPELLFKYISPEPQNTELVYAFYIKCEEPLEYFLEGEMGNFLSFEDIRDRASEGTIFARVLSEAGILEKIIREANQEKQNSLKKEKKRNKNIK